MAKYKAPEEIWDSYFPSDQQKEYRDNKNKEFSHYFRKKREWQLEEAKAYSEAQKATKKDVNKKEIVGDSKPFSTHGPEFKKKYKEILSQGKEEWELLRGESMNHGFEYGLYTEPIMEKAGLMYAEHIMGKEDLDSIDAVAKAGEMLHKLKKEAIIKFPGFDNMSLENRDKFYFSEILKLLKS